MARWAARDGERRAGGPNAALNPEEYSAWWQCSRSGTIADENPDVRRGFRSAEEDDGSSHAILSKRAQNTGVHRRFPRCDDRSPSLDTIRAEHVENTGVHRWFCCDVGQSIATCMVLDKTQRKHRHSLHFPGAFCDEIPRRHHQSRNIRKPLRRAVLSACSSGPKHFGNSQYDCRQETLCTPVFLD